MTKKQEVNYTFWLELPEEIKKVMLQRQREQTGTCDEKVFEENVNSSFDEGGFDWDNTFEGSSFWVEILHKKNLRVFYDKYPKPKITSYICNSIPIGAIRLRVIQPLKYIDNFGFEKAIPVGSITWAEEKYRCRIGSSSNSVHIENNKYHTNFAGDCFEIIEEKKATSYLCLAPKENSIMLKVIKPIKHNHSFGKMILPNIPVGSITWCSPSYITDVGVESNTVILEDNRHGINFDGGCFEVVKYPIDTTTSIVEKPIIFKPIIAPDASLVIKGEKSEDIGFKISYHKSVF